MPADPIGHAAMPGGFLLGTMVEEHVPMPERYRRCKYPWHELQVGQSFAVPYTRSFQRNAHTTAKRLGIKVETRTMVRDGRRVLRIWRRA